MEPLIFDLWSGGGGGASLRITPHGCEGIEMSVLGGSQPGYRDMVFAMMSDSLLTVHSLVQIEEAISVAADLAIVQSPPLAHVSMRLPAVHPTILRNSLSDQTGPKTSMASGLSLYQWSPVQRASGKSIGNLCPFVEDSG